MMNIMWIVDRQNEENLSLFEISKDPKDGRLIISAREKYCSTKVVNTGHVLR